MTVLLGLVALAILLWAAQKYLQADPRKLAAVLKLAGGISLLAFAAFLGARGEIAIAAPLAAAGLGLLGWLPFGPAGFGARTQKSSGQVSRVRSAFLEAYLERSGARPIFLPADRPLTSAVLQAFELEKAAYELEYELNNRPDWVRIPPVGISKLVDELLRTD